MLAAADHDGLSLTEILRRLGYRHASAGDTGMRLIVRESDGTLEVHRGNYESTVDWLCETRQIEPSPTTVERWRRDAAWSDRARQLLASLGGAA